MADRTLIGVQSHTGYRAHYCYHGGAPDWNGLILLQHYRTPDQVNRLLDGGPMSTLGPTPETPACVSWRSDDMHSPDQPLDCVTRHYKQNPADQRQFMPEFTGRKAEDFWNIRFAHGPDYYYLLTPDGWYVSCFGEPDRPPEPLAAYMVEFVRESAVHEHCGDDYAE